MGLKISIMAGAVSIGLLAGSAATATEVKRLHKTDSVRRTGKVTEPHRARTIERRDLREGRLPTRRFILQ